MGKIFSKYFYLKSLWEYIQVYIFLFGKTLHLSYVIVNCFTFKYSPRVYSLCLYRSTFNISTFFRKFCEENQFP